MLKSISREEKDFVVCFQEHIDSEKVSENDRFLLNKLKPFISISGRDEYSQAICNYKLNTDKISEDDTIIGTYYQAFWDRHKRIIKDVLEDSEECPVCGLSYDIENFGKNYIKTIEHVLPKSKYQQYILSPINLVYFCNFCNKKKSDKINGDRIFHPLFSQINCCSQTIIKLSLVKGFQVKIEVKIVEPNLDYFHFINDIFEIQKKYKNFIMQILNTYISSIENGIKKRLKGLLLEEKYNTLSQLIDESFLQKVLTNQFIKTETEQMIEMNLKSAIKRNPKTFARYVIDNSNVLKNI
jgi:hypothetical protein